MEIAPNIVGGQPVVAYSSINQRHQPTGGCQQVVGGVLQGPAAGLAICQVEKGGGFYLFGCDEKWCVKTDTFHQTLEEAMDQGEFEYRGIRRTWLNHDPAWKPLAESDEKRAWDFLYDHLAFHPSTAASNWPGITEPPDSLTFDISQFLDGSEFARRVDEIALNAEVIELFRMCILPGETMVALDWQHPSYAFNPFGRFDFSQLSNVMIPVTPNGDYYIFLANDFRFGIFAHPWERTICVFGQPPLNVVIKEKPMLLQRIIRRGGKAL